MLELSGGGACWDRRSCFGPVPLTDLSLQGPGNPTGLASADPKASPLADATYVWFPYCTGDVHAGRHVANYGGAQVHHWGGHNVRASIEELEQNLNVLSQAQEVFLVGRSAGAIGVLLHLSWLDALLPADARRTALLDSAGLHFGEDFWNKFSDDYFGDVQDHMAEIGLMIDRSTGFVAPQIPKLCRRFDHWKMGFVQSLRDIVMSTVFGSTGQRQHEQRVLSPEGLAALAYGRHGHCSAWVHDSATHTFTGSPSGLNKQTRGVTVGQFAASVLGPGPTASILP